MKKFASISFLVFAVILAGEIAISPLMHNHDDAKEHYDCPAYIISSQQISDSAEFFVEINISPQTVQFDIRTQTVEKPFHTSLETSRNKAPPLA